MGGANVMVAAIDSTKVEFGLVAGYVEPEQAVVPPGHRLAVIPKESVDRLLAITNGGFKRRHGQHGFKIGDDVYVPPKDADCTVAVTKSGEVRIGTWTRLKSSEADLAWYRQAGPCLVEDGAKTKDAGAPFDGWKYGTSLEGNKDVRRSAYAISKDGKVLYFAIGDMVDPNALADALVAVHVEAACQFDINFSFTRFVLFDRNEKGEPVGSSPLMKGLVFAPEEGWKTPAQRDFFYLVKKPETRAVP
ncbi:MAG: phosphodiester glycosidase family protein [Polyangiaceae bacterium]